MPSCTGVNKNLAIANRSRVNCAHNTSRASMITPWHWNVGQGSLKVTGNGPISRVNWRWILSWPWNVGQRSLKVIENGTIWKLRYGYLFAFHSNYDRIEIFSVKEWPDLEIWFWVVQGHWQCNYGALVSSARYSALLVENREIFIPHLYFIAPAGGDPVGILWRFMMLIKLQWFGYCMVKKNYDNMLSRFHSIPERHGRTDGGTDGITISISRVSVLTRDKNWDRLSFKRPRRAFCL